jgi:hypothetical protein
MSVVHAVGRVTLAVIFLYQGLIPKIVYRHPSEIRMLTDAGLEMTTADRALAAIGVAEVALGVVLLIAWHARSPLVVILALMAFALAALPVTSPWALVGAFNPVALNAAVAALAFITWQTSRDLPSAAHCRRDRPDRLPEDAR